MRRPRLPSLTGFRNFEAAARHKSFTKAAQELSVTQGAVSHQVKLLEEELQVNLLTRGRLGIELTPLGSKLFAVLSNAFDDLADVVGEVREEAATIRKRLKIRVSPQFCHFWLAPRITKYSAENLDIEVHISAASSVWPITVDDQALMIVPAADDEMSHSADRLFSSDLMPLCSPSLLGNGGKRRETEFLQQATLLCETDHDWWPDWYEVVGERRALHNQRLFFDDPVAMVRVATSGEGVMMGSPRLLRDYVAKSQLVVPFNPSPHVSRAYFLVCGNTAISSGPAQAFRSWLLNEISLDTRLCESIA